MEEIVKYEKNISCNSLHINDFTSVSHQRRNN